MWDGYINSFAQDSAQMIDLRNSFIEDGYAIVDLELNLKV